MRLALTVVSPATRQLADVLLDADPATPVGGDRRRARPFAAGGWRGTWTTRRRQRAPTAGSRGGARILRFPGPRPQGSLAVSAPAPRAQPWAPPLYVDYQLVPADLSLAQSPLRDGSVISLGSPEGACTPSRPASSRSGWRRPRRGRGAPARASARPPSAAASRPPSGCTIPRSPSSPCTSASTGAAAARSPPTRGWRATLEGEPLTAPGQWQPGQQIAVGATLLGLAPYEPPDAALHPSEDGAGIDFNRPPRLLPRSGSPGSGCRCRRPRASAGRSRC